MMNAKSKTMLAGALAATLTLVAIGCGDGKGRPAPVRRSGMPSGSGKTGAATNGIAEGQAGAEGTGGGTSVRGKTTPANGNGKQAGAAGSATNGQGKSTPQAAPKADPNEAEIEKQEAAMKAGVPITREQMPTGTFRLESSVTSVFVSNNNVFARAIQSNSVKETGGGFQLESVSKLASGFLPSHTDDGRVLDIPFQFDVVAQSGKWSTANVVPVAVRSFTTTETGKLEITDRMAAASGGTSNLVNIITANALTDRTYTGKDEAQKKLEVSLFKIDDQTLRVFVSVEELVPAGVDKTGTQSVMFYRNFFLTYKLTTAAQAGAGQTK